MPFLKHLYLFIKNNLLQLQRKWLSLPLLILFPVAILLLITTIAITVISPSDQEPVQIGFVDLDQSEETQLIMGMITEDRKSTRLNSSHVAISYAAFCLKQITH